MRNNQIEKSGFGVFCIWGKERERERKLEFVDSVGLAGNVREGKVGERRIFPKYAERDGEILGIFFVILY